MLIGLKITNGNWQLVFWCRIAAASILTFFGVKHWGKKDNGGSPNKGSEPIKDNNDNKPIKNKDIPKKSIEDPKKIINEQIINIE